MAELDGEMALTVKKRPFIIACIPAYNEEETIAKVVVKAQRYADNVVVCDDGSTDLTGEIAGRLGAVVVRHDRNMGYGAALRSLFLKAKELEADVTVTLDGDGQHDPGFIPTLIDPVLHGEADMVVGSRFFFFSDTPLLRKVAIKVIGGASRIRTVKDVQSGFRAYSPRAIEALTPTEQGMGASVEILLKAEEAGLKVVEVPIKVSYERIRRPKQNPVFHTADVLSSALKHLSMRHPLLFYGVPGLMALAMGLFFGFWAFDLYSKEGRLVTNLALMSVFGFIAGLMLVTTGMILFTIISTVREK